LDLLSRLQEENKMAMVLITHDFGVIAGRTHNVMVLYGGKVAEVGSAPSLFTHVRHPYTASLLASIPRLENKSHTRLRAIPGQPVDVINPGPGCRFAGRCRHAQPRCLEESPPLTSSATAGHAYACFYPVGTEEGESALASNRKAGKTAAGLKLRSGVEVAAP
jgi:peptide/nickel transport system ATP-binding protein